MGLIIQQTKQINPINTAISRIRKEKLMAISWLMEKAERSRIKVASRVPSPKMETGRRLISAAIVIVIEIKRKETVLIPILRAKKKLCR